MNVGSSGEARNGVAIVTLNRPQVLNALDVPAKERLGAIWQEIADDPPCASRCSPAPARRRSAPAPTSRRSTGPAAWCRPTRCCARFPVSAFRSMKPVIAALHGYCVGMGMTLALHCDLRLAAKNTVLGYPEVKHGMISAVSAIHLPQVIAERPRARDAAPRAQHVCRGGPAHRPLERRRRRCAGRGGGMGGDDRRLFARRRAGDQAPGDVLAARCDAERAEIEAVRALVEARDDYKEGAATFAKRGD